MSRVGQEEREGWESSQEGQEDQEAFVKGWEWSGVEGEDRRPCQ